MTEASDRAAQTNGMIIDKVKAKEIEGTRSYRLDGIGRKQMVGTRIKKLRN